MRDPQVQERKMFDSRAACVRRLRTALSEGNEADARRLMKRVNDILDTHRTGIAFGRLYNSETGEHAAIDDRDFTAVLDAARAGH